MIPALLPPNEQERLDALAAYEILDTSAEPAYDELVALAAELCEVPMALMSLVDRERLWVKASSGLRSWDLPRWQSFCAHTILEEDLLVIPDATDDPRFANLPLVAAEPHIRFYAGAVLRGRGGHRLGTLCILDRATRPFTGKQEQILLRLRRQVEAQLELRLQSKELAASDARWRAEHDLVRRLQRKRASLAKLIAQDVNDPLAVLLSNTRYLAQQPRPPSDWREILRDMVEAGHQMESMVRDILDVSASEDGELMLCLDRFDLEKLVLETTSAVATSTQGRQQTLSVSLGWADNEIRADRELVRRVLENLVGRALRSTPPGGKVEVEGVAFDQDFGLRIRDAGPTLPLAAREKIFDQYARVEQQHLFGRQFEFDRGMGLSFCRAAIEAHGGRIWVEENDPLGNVFCVRLPSNGEARNGSGT